MKIKIKDINTFTKELSIKVEWSDLENAYNIEFKKKF